MYVPGTLLLLAFGRNCKLLARVLAKGVKESPHVVVSDSRNAFVEGHHIFVALLVAYASVDSRRVMKN